MISIYSDYISYIVHSMQTRFPPTNIFHCLICASYLTESDIWPSEAMNSILKDISSTSRVSDPSGYSRLFECNKCHWWCIRENYTFFDFEVLMYYGPDNLIAGVAKDNASVIDEHTPLAETQPWLKALNDPSVYDNRSNLPKELAALFKVPMVLELRR